MDMALQLTTDKGTRYLNGLVNHFSQTGQTKSIQAKETFTRYRLDLVPEVWVPALLYPIDLLNLRAPLVALAVVWLLWKGSAADNRLILLFAMLLLVFVTVIRGKPIFYGILVSPAADLVAASFLALMAMYAGHAASL